MEDIRLKPCPFCGATVAQFTNAHDLEECGNFEDENCPCERYEQPRNCSFISIVCNMNKGGCGSSSGYFSTEKQAAEEWNRRA